MLEDVKTKLDAILARNAIAAMKGSDRCPGGLPPHISMVWPSLGTISGNVGLAALSLMRPAR